LKTLVLLMEELKGRIKHEVSDTNVLTVLESIYQLYRSCDIARTYSDVVEKSIAEFRGERIPLQPLFICFVNNMKGNLTFPAMASWEKRAQFLLIHDEFYPLEFSYNDWKKHVKIQDYVDVKLLTAPTRKIITTPETKTVTLRQQSKEFIMDLKKEFDYDTIDDSISYILQQTNAWKLVNFISRLLDGSATLGEMDMMRPFGGFIFCLGEQRDGDSIQIVSEFFPYVYNLNFATLINEVEVNVKAK